MERRIIDSIDLNTGTWSGVIVHGLDEDDMTYSSIERERGTLDQLLNKLREDNIAGIKIFNVRRRRERSYTAKVYVVPLTMFIEALEEEVGRELSYERKGISVYAQKDGQGFLITQSRGCQTVERVYVIKHEIADGTIPFWYDHKKQPCATLCASYDICFSDYRQASLFCEHLWDRCVRIDKLYIDPRFDVRFPADEFY